MTDLHPPVALITGGSRGLGRNTALHLARKGCDVVLTFHSRKEDAASAVAEIEAMGRKALALQLDTAKTGGFAEFGTGLRAALTDLRGDAQLDFLVNNAGTGINVPFADTTEAQFDDMMAVHLKGVFFLTQAMLPLIRDGGRIVNISSGLARFSLPGYAAYAAMKGGVEVMTRYLARELGPRGISVNVVAPGAIETDFGGGAVRDVAELNQYIASQTAMGRAGLPDDIGGAISSLLMGEMGWMTGQRIEVSGGMLL
ncbi:SDR family NAD(P)-dependent oxidoreductase [Frigidibacter sp.]|uniref:SDR family NAD(P)-dependent oxidoreductase n=1 Tax=Frigidibacter sp. TaxID=2586418 RepID=UPI0027342430|nr:SDR family oxidoreductase [Frigidibacter sp.]MDP3339625.1 SDR family oxidoreductase [Frigidibacter sp.]